jgi:cytochrome c
LLFINCAGRRLRATPGDVFLPIAGAGPRGVVAVLSSRELLLEFVKGKRVEGPEFCSGTGRDMFDTMVITKVVGALCGALLIFLVGKWVADSLYMPAAHAEHVAVYPVHTEAVEAAAEPAAEAGAVDVAALYAQADATAGETLWRNCRACHSLEAGRGGTGPSLHGVVGRGIDAVEGFNYSGALLAMGDTWTVEALNTFLESPRNAAPGTRMSFAGLRNLEDRLNLIKYLESQGG